MPAATVTTTARYTATFAHSTGAPSGGAPDLTDPFSVGRDEPRTFGGHGVDANLEAIGSFLHEGDDQIVDASRGREEELLGRAAARHRPGKHDAEDVGIGGHAHD